MINREQMKILVAASEILDSVRTEMQASIRLSPNDPVSKLSMIVDDLHHVISRLENIIEAQDRR